MRTTKLIQLHQIVRLRQIVKKWQKFATMEKGFSPLGCTSSPGRRRSLYVFHSANEDWKRSTSSPPPDVPKGCVAVYVGEERKRYVIRTCYLSHPLFRQLLELAEEEFGFDHEGGITLPCEVLLFDSLLPLFRKKDDGAVQNLNLQAMFNFSSCRDVCAGAMESKRLALERRHLLASPAAQRSCG